jgi:signal transduction histidine kinase/ligand-binding sensor domain-containing protein
MGSVRSWRRARAWAVAGGIAAWCALASPADALDGDRAITQYLVDRWSTADGLPRDTVQTITQTPDGYLWVGTEAGLVRFDGVRFVAFEPPDVPSLRGANITALFAASDGSLLIGTLAGTVARYTPGPEGGVRTLTVTAPHTPPTYVRGFIEDREGALWVGAWEGAYRADGTHLIPLKSDAWGVYHFAADRDGALWAGSRTGLVQIGNDRAQHVEMPLPAVAIHSVRPAREGGLWVAVRGHLVRVDGTTTTVLNLPDPVPGPAVRAVLEDRHGNVWVGGWGGLARLRHGRFEPVPRLAGFADQAVTTLFEDREGGVWVGTRGGGLTRFRDPSVLTFGVEEGLSVSDIQGVLPDSAGRVWVGASSLGVDVLERGRWRSLHHTRLGQRQLYGLAEDDLGRVWFALEDGLVVFDGARYVEVVLPGIAPDSSVDAVCRASDGGLWVAAQGRLFRSDGTDWRELALGKDASLAPAVVFGEGPDGVLRYGSMAGLVEVRNGRPALVWRAPNEEGRPVALSAESDGTVWLGTRGQGLVRWRAGEARTFTRADGLPDDWVLAVLDGNDGTLWLATHAGLVRVRKAEMAANGPLRRTGVIAVGDGLRSNYCDDSARPVLARARDGRLWLATTRGVSAVNPLNLPHAFTPPSVIVEGVSVDGRDVAPGGAAPPGDGTLRVEYTATSLQSPHLVVFRHRLDGFDRGWVEAGRSRAARYTNLPPGTYQFVVEARHVGGEWTAVAAVAPVTLLPHFYETRLAILLALGGLVAAVAAFVAWRGRQALARQRELAALVDERTRALQAEIQERRTTEVALRDSEARASQIAAQLQRAHDELELRVRDRTSELRAEVEVRRRTESELVVAKDAAEAASRAKSAFVANMSHELRTPLNAVLGYAELVSDDLRDHGLTELLPDLERIRTSGAQLLRLVNDVLDVSIIDAGNMRVSSQLADLHELLRNLVEEMRAPAETQRNRLVLSDTLPAGPSVIDAARLKQVLAHLVSNACKFTTDGQITLAARLDVNAPGDEWFEFAVADTGIGIAPEHMRRLFSDFSQADESSTRQYGGSGLGLALSQRLCRLLGGQITVQSEPGRGTRFVVRLPVDQERSLHAEVPPTAD